MSSRCSACSARPAYERSAPDPLPGPDLIARPDNAILQVRPAPYRRARQEDALLYGRPVTHPTFQEPREDILREVEEGTLRYVVEDFRLQDVDAGVGQVALGF